MSNTKYGFEDFKIVQILTIRQNWMDNLHDQFKGYHTGISAKSLNLLRKELGGLVCARGLD